MLINAFRGHLGEDGIVSAQGPAWVRTALGVIDREESQLPDPARVALAALGAQLANLEDEIAALEKRVLAWHGANETSRRLATIPV